MCGHISYIYISSGGGKGEKGGGFSGGGGGMRGEGGSSYSLVPVQCRCEPVFIPVHHSPLLLPLPHMQASQAPG